METMEKAAVVFIFCGGDWGDVAWCRVWGLGTGVFEVSWLDV